jgi:hypothetical protein
MSTFPQYARTTDHEVIAAVQVNQDGWRDFHQRACAFSLAQGVEKGAYIPSSFAGGHRVRALGGDVRPETGRWKQGYGGYGWLPFKNNQLHDELEAIKFDEADVPGLPAVIDGPYLPNGSHTIATPRPFIHDGAVYVGFNFRPVDMQYQNRQPQPEDGGWEEIKASEYHKAVEAYKEALAATTATTGEQA